MKLTKLDGIQRGFAQRTITEADLLNGWKMGTVKEITLTRTDNIVTMEFPALALTGENKTGGGFFAIPPGFRPAMIGNYGILGALESAGQLYPVHRDFNNIDIVVSGSVSGVLMWRTTDSFPTI